MMCELNLKQITESSTRIADISQSLIDVIFVYSRKHSPGVLNCTISNHLPVYITLKLKPIKPPPTYDTVRSYRTTQPKSHNLFRAVENSIEQCFADVVNNIVQHC